ncbi:MAG TPA: urease accessory UreF family protein [Ramlibacter sp.]|jgi:urease accessory protein|nr:urease accessory UreF family protein [Ramlibacter sp.]
MSTTTDTGTDAALLQLMWLASPALPVGGFSYSEGLEAAVEAQLVRDEASAGDWLVAQLHASLARSDLAVVAKAVDAVRAKDTQGVDALDAWVRQTRETSELLQQAEQMGRSLNEWRKSVGWAAEGIPTAHVGVPAATHPTNTFPVAFARVAACTPASTRQVTLTYAFSWSENMMQAAIKAVPLGQSAGQRILARLAQEIPGAVDHAMRLADADRQSFTPMLAILSAQHETQYSRLFRS